MKVHRDAGELAARLGAAANQPLPTPNPPAPIAAPKTVVPMVPKVSAPPRIKAKRVTTEGKTNGADVCATVPVTIRPERTLLHFYTLEAVERTKETGRVTSAQEMMLEVLESAARRKQTGKQSLVQELEASA